jgi:hypothetical protein
MRLIDSAVSLSPALTFTKPTTDSPDMPDLQYAASHNDTMIGLRDHVLPRRCEASPSMPKTLLTLL